jgi:hypothetical protein
MDMTRTLAFVVGVTLTLAAPAAYADCVTGGKQVGHSPVVLGARPAAAYGSGAVGAAPGPDNSNPNNIVGLWSVTFLVGSDPNQVWDQGYEQFHADGTEFTMDVAVTPAMGNVCVGVWKPAAKQVKLHHVGFNWDATSLPGTLAGTFVLDMTVTLAKSGDSFTGTYVSDSFDLDGNKIDALHATGTINGNRISVP